MDQNVQVDELSKMFTKRAIDGWRAVKPPLSYAGQSKLLWTTSSVVLTLWLYLLLFKLIFYSRRSLTAFLSYLCTKQTIWLWRKNCDKYRPIAYVLGLLGLHWVFIFWGGGGGGVGVWGGGGGLVASPARVCLPGVWNITHSAAARFHD
jgi:hypothetical protein